MADSYYGDLEDGSDSYEELGGAMTAALGAPSTLGRSARRGSTYEFFGSDAERDVRVGRLDQVDPLGSTLAGISARPDRVAQATRARAELEYEERRRARILEDRDIEWTNLERNNALEVRNYHASRRNLISVDNTGFHRDLDDLQSKMGRVDVPVSEIQRLVKLYPNAIHHPEGKATLLSFGPEFEEEAVKRSIRQQQDQSYASARGSSEGKIDAEAELAYFGLPASSRVVADSSMAEGRPRSAAVAEAGQAASVEEQANQFLDMGIPIDRINAARVAPGGAFKPEALADIRKDVSTITRLEKREAALMEDLKFFQKLSDDAGEGLNVGQYKDDLNRVKSGLTLVKRQLEVARVKLEGGESQPVNTGGGYASRTAGDPASQPDATPTPKASPSKTPTPKASPSKTPSPEVEEDKQTSAGGW